MRIAFGFAIVGLSCCLGCGDPATPAAPEMQAPGETTTQPTTAMGEPETPVSKAMAELPPADQVLAMKQKLCPVSNEALGSMGAPVKVEVNGKPVFICCAHCEEAIKNSPEKYLAKAMGEAPVAAPQEPAVETPAAVETPTPPASEAAPAAPAETPAEPAAPATPETNAPSSDGPSLSPAG